MGLMMCVIIHIINVLVERVQEAEKSKGFKIP